MARHEEFLELGAVSTTGSLSEAEEAKLEAHVAKCADCRAALKEFQEAAAIAGPLFAAEGSQESHLADETWSVDEAEKRLRERVGANGRKTAFRSGRVPFEALSNSERPPIADHWSVAWASLAAILLLSAALGVVAYRVGMNRGVESVKPLPTSDPVATPKVQEEASDRGHERQTLLAQLAQRDRSLDELRHLVDRKSQEITELKENQAKLQQATAGSEGEKQQLSDATAQLSKKLEAAESSLRKTQSELESMRAERGKDDVQAKVLQAKVDDLNRLLEERETTIDRQQEFLAKDRDIRELMGARDLYIAEVFDVAKTGVTKKPYGRVFYTKGKSLVFFAYDLDKQAGVRDASTFQAWGRRGSDKSQSLNLGIFYEDSSSKKRWKLQFDDPQKLEQIDAVFVTVEPAGGSRLPSGKQLLFAYLKIDPNHP
jgi:hypothetical protein